MGASSSRQIMCQDCHRFFEQKGATSSTVKNALRSNDNKARCDECAARLRTYVCLVCSTIFIKPAIGSSSEHRPNAEARGEDQPSIEHNPKDHVVCDSCTSVMTMVHCGMCGEYYTAYKHKPGNQREPQGDELGPNVAANPPQDNAAVCSKCGETQRQQFGDQVKFVTYTEGPTVKRMVGTSEEVAAFLRGTMVNGISLPSAPAIEATPEVQQNPNPAPS